MVTTFKELEQAGYYCEYAKRLLDGSWVPLMTLESCYERFAGKGERVRYTGEGGYDQQHANIQRFGSLPGDTMIVKTCSIGGSCSYYEFEGIGGSHNTVMFERIKDV